MNPPVSSGFGRASYRDIELYAPDRAPCAIDLSDNTNLWGTPPASLRAIAHVGSSSAARYPQLYAADLKRAIAAYVGAPPNMIVTGCGSDDILDSAIRAFMEPGDQIVLPDPTFPMIPLFARMNGASGVAVPLTPDYDADAEAMLEVDARVIYICSPNNPTGAAFERETIEAIIERARADQVIILDEAYAEFAGTSLVDLTRRYPRLLVTRTLSKAFGLAGLRVGYAVGAPELVAEVEKSRGPYKVNAVAQAAALAALDEGITWVNEHVATTIDNRAWISKELSVRGLAPIPSAANFILLPIANASAIAGAMRAAGVAVRAFDGLPAISDALRDSRGSALRITIGPWEMMLEALAVLDAARQSCG